MLTKAPLLVHFNPALLIIVHADASPYGLGGVLSRQMKDGTERPVCFASRTLASAERNYGHIEKEGLALVYAVKKFHNYLYSQKFKMMRNHKPLLGLFGEDKGYPDKTAARILRWALLLSAYDYKVEYIPGALNGNADGLSRLPIQACSEDISQTAVSIQMELVMHDGTCRWKEDEDCLGEEEQEWGSQECWCTYTYLWGRGYRLGEEFWEWEEVAARSYCHHSKKG